MSNRFHVCDVSRRSGITKYAMDFHRQVLEPLGYELTPPQDLKAQLRDAPAAAAFHFQMGAGQFEERLALSQVLDAGFANVDATLHDPPFLTFPFYAFRSPILMRMSRAFDWYLNSLGQQRRTIAQLRTAYVLSAEGAASLSRQGALNVTHIPHLVLPEEITWNAGAATEDLLYFGFIGRGKGLEYALALHEELLRLAPELKLHVIGQAMGARDKAYFDDLKARYAKQTVFHGYVEEGALNTLFYQIRHVLLPFKPYKYFTPISGSVINALKRGRIVWTTPVNAIPELIRDGENGFFLTGDLEQDAERLVSLSQKPSRLEDVARAAFASVAALSNYPYREALTAAASGAESGTTGLAREGS